MAAAETIAVEVAYATPARQRLIPLQVPAGSTLAQCIAMSGLLAACPEIDLQQQEIGVFGQVRAAETPAAAGDRIEIYRPLLQHPMQARRNRLK